MRIRKCAARLLGSSPAGLSSSPPPPPPPPLPRPWDSEASSSTSSGVFCDLNRSPWDDLMCLELLACDDQEEDEDGGITGNGTEPEAAGERGISTNKIKFGGAIAVSPIAQRGTSMKTLPDKKVEESAHKETAAPASAKKKKNKNKKKDDDAAAVTEASTSCKKTDGKGWHCKRTAQHPHSLCSYHLAQLRSYGHGKAEQVKEGHGGDYSRKKKSDVGGRTRVDSDFYYYYSGFGPWRGKTRGGGDDDVTRFTHQVVEDEEEEEEDNDNEIYNSRKTLVAGEDEEDESDDGINGDTVDGGVDTSRKSGEGEKTTVYNHKKRGRKKMKARSLKSLL